MSGGGENVIWNDGNVFKQCFLIAFDNENVIRLFGFDNIFRCFNLGVEGIGGDYSALYIEIFEQDL